MSAILAAILDFSKILFFAKLQQILLELVENMYINKIWMQGYYNNIIFE